MAWNATVYNQFKTQRHAPYYDLLKMVMPRDSMQVIDLGCGTGELTRQLADSLANASVLGIDSSADMLSESVQYTREGLTFAQCSIQNVLDDEKHWDLIVSNAALQWVDDHRSLLKKIAGILKPGGQLAIQVPDQRQNAANRLINELGSTEPFRSALKGWNRYTPVLEINEYASLLFSLGGEKIEVIERIYPLIMGSPEELYQWLSGSTLIPYRERLPAELQDNFSKEFKKILDKEFPSRPLFYPFRRIFFSAVFN